MPKVIDVFSGVGGLSLGAVKAGFNLVGAIELDPIAIMSHELNFPNSKHLNRDVSALSGKEVLKSIGIKKGELSGLIGGPPCQGFSSMGRQLVTDPRNILFIHFFRLVKELNPGFFVAENVPGILSPKFDVIRKQAFELLPKKYTILPPLVLNAQNFGVPTSRQRVFFIGYDRRRVEHLSSNSIRTDEHTNYNYVKDALAGLPDKVKCIETKRDNSYYWCKIEKPKDGSYSENISMVFDTNIGNKEAMRRYSESLEVTGMNGTKHSEEVMLRYLSIAQGQSDIVSKSFRLDPDGFCPTLRAGTNKEHGSFQAVRPLHPTEGRVITPREAARLQGFPDWFLFHRTIWHSFRQIGNSVSPLLAYEILNVIEQKLK